MPIIRLAFVLALCLGLPACGDDVPTGNPGGVLPPGFDPNDPEAAAKAVEHVVDRALEVELDDGTLEKLLAMHRRVLAAGDDVRGAMAIGAGTAWNFATYNQAMLKWQAMEDAVGRNGASARRELEQLDERIAELEGELKAAEGPARERTQQMLDLQKRMRPSLAKHVEILQKLDTPEVKALVERWKPRFDAVEAEFDED